MSKKVFFYKIIICFLLTLISPYNVSHGLAFSSDQILNNSLKRCYSFRKSKDCLNALNYIEHLQIEASSRNNYRCQTHLLGISSDVIMALFGKRVKTSHQKKIKNLNKYCET